MMSTRTVIALAVSVTAIDASVASAVWAQAPLAAFPKVDVATIHRNKEIESIRAAASPNAPLGPSRLRVMPGGRLEGTDRSHGARSFRGGGVANAGPDDPRPRMTTAVQQMLGLKLERVRGVADVIVVERIERPTEN